MAVDSNFQLFSKDLFFILFDKKASDDNSGKRLRKCNEAFIEYKCTDVIVHAVRCRELFFHNTLNRKLRADINFFSESTLDFYMYLQNNMTQFIAFNEFNVFDKLFMTCAVTSLMVLNCDSKSRSMYIQTAIICWAMYFDTNFRNEFYKKGGWEKLEASADSYSKVFLMECSVKNKNDEKNDFLNARECFEQQNWNYSTGMIISEMQRKMLKSKNSACPECLSVLCAVATIYFKSENNFTEYKFCECYLQVFKLMLSSEEMLESENEIFRNLEMVAGKPPEGSRNSLHKDKFTFDEIYCPFNKQLNDLNASKFLARLFNCDTELSDDKQCMVCGSNVESGTSASDQIEKIKLVISDTLLDVGGKTESSKSPVNADKSRTLGVQPVVHDILQSLNGKKESKNVVEMNKAYAAMHTQKSPEDEVEEKKSKKKRKKKKK